MWKNRIALSDVALEIERCFMPESNASIVIESLLRCKNVADAQRYLNRRHFLDARGGLDSDDNDVQDDAGSYIHADEDIDHNRFPDTSPSCDTQIEEVTGSNTREGERADDGTQRGD